LTAGALVAKAGASFGLMAVSGFLGQVGGDLIVFSLGRRFGLRALCLPGIRRVLNAQRVDWVRRVFGRHGSRLVFAVRFLPGLRLPTYLIAGMSGLARSRFLVADMLAALMCAPLMVFLGYRFGPAIWRVLQRDFWVLIVVLGSVVLAWAAARRWRGAQRRGKGLRFNTFRTP
jgi:membrane protein DedA with SNARE-associated domain